MFVLPVFLQFSTLYLYPVLTMLQPLTEWRQPYPAACTESQPILLNLLRVNHLISWIISLTSVSCHKHSLVHGKRHKSFHYFKLVIIPRLITVDLYRSLIPCGNYLKGLCTANIISILKHIIHYHQLSQVSGRGSWLAPASLTSITIFIRRLMELWINWKTEASNTLQVLIVSLDEKNNAPK